MGATAKWRQVRPHPHRTNTGSPATVGNAECFMQVEMGDVGSELAGLCYTNE